MYHEQVDILRSQRFRSVDFKQKSTVLQQSIFSKSRHFITEFFYQSPFNSNRRFILIERVCKVEFFLSAFLLLRLVYSTLSISLLSMSIRLCTSLYRIYENVYALSPFFSVPAPSLKPKQSQNPPADPPHRQALGNYHRCSRATTCKIIN